MLLASLLTWRVPVTSAAASAPATRASMASPSFGTADVVFLTYCSCLYFKMRSSSVSSCCKAAFR